MNLEEVSYSIKVSSSTRYTVCVDGFGWFFARREVVGFVRVQLKLGVIEASRILIMSLVCGLLPSIFFPYRRKSPLSALGLT